MCFGGTISCLRCHSPLRPTSLFSLTGKKPWSTAFFGWGTISHYRTRNNGTRQPWDHGKHGLEQVFPLLSCLIFSGICHRDNKVNLHSQDAHSRRAALCRASPTASILLMFMYFVVAVYFSLIPGTQLDSSGRQRNHFVFLSYCIKKGTGTWHIVVRTTEIIQ